MDCDKRSKSGRKTSKSQYIDKNLSYKVFGSHCLRFGDRLRTRHNRQTKAVNDEGGYANDLYFWCRFEELKQIPKAY